MALQLIPRRIPLHGGGFADVPVQWEHGRLLADEESEGVEHMRLTGVILVPRVASCGGLLVHHSTLGEAPGEPVIVRIARL